LIQAAVGLCGGAMLFKPLFDDAIVKHNVVPGQLTLHADRGGPMKAKATALLLADLGTGYKAVARRSAPVGKLRLGQATHPCRRAGIGLMTPDQVHYGQADEVHAARQKTLEDGIACAPAAHLALALRRVPDLYFKADAQSRTAQHGLS
jgi:putative transposase